MSISKRGNTYWYEFVIDGVRHRGSTKLSNKEKARNVESAVRTEIVNGRFGIVKREPAPTFAEFYPAYIQRLKNKSESTHPRTIENTEQMLTRLSRFKPLVNAKLDAINDELLAKFVTWHRNAKTPNGQRYSAGSINRSLGTVQAVVRLAIKVNASSKKWTPFTCANFADHMLEEHTREFVLVGAQREEFLGGLAEPCRTVARFNMDTGLRISECCELTWDRVLYDPARDKMFIYVIRGKSKKATRYILLTDEARAIVEKQRTISRSNYVFVRVGAKVDKALWYVAPLSRHTVSHQFKERRREMGLPKDAVLHSTRHTFLTELGATGLDVFSLKEVAGHASVTQSEKYVHPISDTLVSAMERFSEARRQQKGARAPLALVSNGKPSALPTISPTAEIAPQENAGK